MDTSRSSRGGPQRGVNHGSERSGQFACAEISKVRRAWKLGCVGTGTAAAAMGSAVALTLLALGLSSQLAIHWLVPSRLAVALVACVVAAKGHLADATVLLTPLATTTLMLQGQIASVSPQGTLAGTTIYGGTYEASFALAAKNLSTAVPCMAGALLALATSIVLGLSRAVLPSA